LGWGGVRGKWRERRDSVQALKIKHPIIPSSTELFVHCATNNVINPNLIVWFSIEC